MIRTLQEATRCGTAGIQTDVTLLGRPWGYRLRDLPPASVSIWHGGCDTIAPISMGRYFHQQIAGSELVVDPQAAHITMMKWHAAEILARFTATAGPILPPAADLLTPREPNCLRNPGHGGRGAGGRTGSCPVSPYSALSSLVAAGCVFAFASCAPSLLAGSRTRTTSSVSSLPSVAVFVVLS